jgi:hypothetical protein
MPDESVGEHFDDAELVQLVKRMRAAQGLRTEAETDAVSGSAIASWHSRKEQQDALWPIAELVGQDSHDSPPHRKDSSQVITTALRSFREVFAHHRQDAEQTIAQLVRRVVNGDKLPADIVVEAAAKAGMTADDVDAMADRMRVRDSLRRVVSEGEGADAEIAVLRREIEKHDAKLEEAVRKHSADVEPLHQQLDAAGARAAAARQASIDLVTARTAEPAHWRELEQLRTALRIASEAVGDLEKEVREQQSRHDDAAEWFRSTGVDPKRIEPIWRNEQTRHTIGNAEERHFLDWLRGKLRVSEARQKLPSAIAARDAAKAEVDDLVTRIRAS